MGSVINSQPEIRRQEVVVMFTDIVDFTDYCDAYGEEASLGLVTLLASCP